MAHPASLNWDPAFEGRDPVEATVEELSRRRKMPAIQFPQNDLAGVGHTAALRHSYRREIRPIRGATIRGRMDSSAHPAGRPGESRRRMARRQLSVSGRATACGPGPIASPSRPWRRQPVRLPDIAHLGFRRGAAADRLAGQGAHGHPEDAPDQDGFDLTFTKPVDAKSAESPDVHPLWYYYLYHSQYGSKTEETPVKVTHVTVSPDRMRVSLTVDKLIPGRIYELRPGHITSVDGGAADHATGCVYAE